jgi:hypothetical protein
VSTIIVLTLFIESAVKEIYPVPSGLRIFMAKLRVLLDEDVRADVKGAFSSKVQVETVAQLGLSGKDDQYIVEEGVLRTCLIVTANKDFVPRYRDH